MNKKDIKILLLFLFLLFLKDGISLLLSAVPGWYGITTENNTNQVKIDTLIRVDTIHSKQTIIQTERQAPPPPAIVYVDKLGEPVEGEQIDTSQHNLAHVYKDSIEDENLTLFYQATVQGNELVQNALDYRLKVPKRIVKTVEINKEIQRPIDGVFVRAGAGFTPLGLNSLTAGVDYINYKGWGLGYEYDLLNNSHAVKASFRILNIRSISRTKRLF